MADEGVCSLADADRLIEEEAADLFNLRLGKCGGVLASARLAERARAHGIECNLGTLVGETGILSRAAEVFGRFIPGFACLDGKEQNLSLLSDDILADPTQAQDGPVSAPGLGADVSPEQVCRYAAAPSPLADRQLRVSSG